MSFVALGLSVLIECDDSRTRSLLSDHYRHLRGSARKRLRYSIRRSTGAARFLLARDSGATVRATDTGDLLYRLDRDLTLRVQEARPDLYFVHAAVLEWRGRALVLVAPSGGGKSTTAWALSHHGFRYLSDELAPIDLRTLAIHPYPRTLSLKTNPPPPYRSPATACRTSTGVRISPRDLPGGVGTSARPLTAVFLLRKVRRGGSSFLRPLGRAEALTRLYGNALNPLAHSGEGLDGVERIVRATNVVELHTGGLAESCRLIESMLKGNRA